MKAIQFLKVIVGINIAWPLYFATVPSARASSLQDISTCRDVLRPGDSIGPDETLCSPNKLFKLRFNSQSQLELDEIVKTANNTDVYRVWIPTGNPERLFQTFDVGNHLILQASDCNLVLYNSGVAVWDTKTYKHNVQNCELYVQDDGNITLVNGERLLWESMTPASRLEREIWSYNFVVSYRYGAKAQELFGLMEHDQDSDECFKKLGNSIVQRTLGRWNLDGARA